MRKIISCLLIVLLLLGSLGGCNKQGTVNTLSDDVRYKDLKPPKTGPVGTWDIPIPAINPLGSQGLYSVTDYGVGDHEVNYIENFVESSHMLEGERWILEVEDPSGAPLYFLKKYAEENKMKVLASPYGDRLTFQLAQDEESLWWGDATTREEGYSLTIVKEQRVPAGKEMKFNLASLGPEVDQLTFVTTSSGKKFQSAALKLPDGKLELEIYDTNASGLVARHISERYSFAAHKTKEYVIDDLPQGEGSITWKFSWNPEEKPSSLSFLLSELQDLPPVKLGDELGALKVCGVPFGSVVVEPQKGSEILHTDFRADDNKFKGDITPEGDTLFWLPAGLWNVVLLADSAGLEHSKTRLVPVNAGEMTVLTLPTSLKSAYFNLNQIFAEADDLTGGIEVIDTKDVGKEATVSLIVKDPQKRDVFPTKENTQIIEGGQKVEIIDITRKVSPPSIVLALDSSGSMQKEMAATLEAAKSFIGSLPDKTNIRVIDFDSSVKVLSGETKEAVLKSMSSMRAEGSTVLFDATMKGLDLLKDKERPTLVVFADGADSSLDGQGVGSSSGKYEVLEKIQEIKIPIFTIGFGDKPDATAMKEFSAASGGRYFSAKDDKALTEVFTAISGTFGNSFDMTYKRPQEASLSDTPVVSIVMDASGSMDEDPAEEGCGYRMDKTKVLFHNFIQKLPDHYLAQFISFQTGALGGRIIRQGQVATQDKNKLLQGVGELEAFGGTPILESITIAYENIRSVPSNKKAIVFLTDAGLAVEESEQAEFEKILAKLKKENIAVLWAGIGVEEYRDVFAKTAELSGGSYIISNEAAGLEAALADLLASIEKMKGNQTLPLSIQINDKTASGEPLNYAANIEVDFTPPPKSGEIIVPDVVQLSTGTPLARYDKAAATMVTGTGVPGVDTILTKRIGLNALANNEAMELKVNEAYYFSKFKGLEPPSGKQFLALELILKNTTSNKIPYLIPSIYSHFYVNINNEGSFPASEATWLTGTPLSNPGEPEIIIPPKKELMGTLVFLVPNEPVTQASLHFYDLIQGHIHLPLVGKMAKGLQQLTDLPTEAPVKITDAFSMAVTATEVVDKIDIYPKEVAEEEQSVFRIVEATFSTKVQALLDITPQDRLWLKIHTENGPLMTKMSEVTTVMPMGFSSPVMLAPASTNKVRLAYPQAKALSGVKTEIWGDVQSGSLEIPVVKGKAYGKALNGKTISGDGLKVKINQLTTLEGSKDFNEYWVIADVTISDTQDGLGTAIPEDFLQLVHKDYVGSNSGAVTGSVGLGNFTSDGEPEGIVQAYGSENYLYGIDSNWAVFDGGERRGFMLFLLPEADTSKWSLQSPYLEKLKEPISQEPYADIELLVPRNHFEILDNEFEALLDEAVKKAILKYQSQKAAAGEPVKVQRVSFSQEDGKNSISKPTITTSGAQKLNAAMTLEDFTHTMASLRWLPSYDGSYRYSPEAVLTQGWGTEWDLANTAMQLLAKMGTTPQYRTIALTAEGKAAIIELPEAQAEEQAKASGGTGKKGILGFFSRLFSNLRSKISSIFKPKEKAEKTTFERMPAIQGNVAKHEKIQEIKELAVATQRDIDEVEDSLAEEEWLEEEEYAEEEPKDTEEQYEEEYEEEDEEDEYEEDEYVEEADGGEGEYSAEEQYDYDEEPSEEATTIKVEFRNNTIPGIAYQTPEGESKLFVIPFMKDISELEGLVYIPHRQSQMVFSPVNATIRVSAKVESTGLLSQGTAGDIADVLGGGDGEAESAYEYLTMLEKEVSLPTLSLDAIEIGYLDAGTGQGKRYTAALFTPEGIEAGTGIVDTGSNPILGVAIEVILPNQNPLIHESPLKKGEALNTLYHTLGINLPDLPDSSVEVLEEASKKTYKEANNPDSFSILKWYSRNIIERFIANQTTFDLEQQQEKGLLLGRTEKARCIVLTSRTGKENTLYSTIDLLQSINQVHNAGQTLQAGYNIVAGLYASSLESAVLTGENKAGYQEIWAGAPKDTSLILVPYGEGRDLVLAEMKKEEKYPARLLETIANSEKIILVPEEPGEYMKQKRWAWLEINPHTYETISVIDTGEHAGMASYAMSLLPSTDDCGQYIVGGLIGVDVAVWAVCSSSLKLGDYKAILADAKATALAVGVELDRVMKGYGAAKDGKISEGVGVGPLKLSASIGKGGFRVGIGQNMIGFSDGFKDGVNMYFALAKPKDPPKNPGPPPKK